MARLSIIDLKSKFQYLSVPTGDDFVDLIDTLENSQLTTNDINPVTDKNYVTDAQLTSIKNFTATLLTKENKSSKGIANGYVALDSNAKITSSQIPTSILGGLNYHGLYDCSTGVSPITINSIKGDYWVCSVEGTINTVHYAINDWLVYNGASLDKIDNQGSSIDSDVNLTANSDSVISTQHAIKTYVDSHTNIYTLPTASSNTLGGVIAGVSGTGINITSQGVISVSGISDVISTNTTLTVGTGQTFATIQAAYDSLKDKWINQDVTVTISVTPEHFSLSNEIILNSHPCGDRIKIVGETPTSKQLLSVASMTLQSNNEYLVTFNITTGQTSNMSVGDFLFVTSDRKTSTPTYYYSFLGAWEITSFQSATTPHTVTVKYQHANNDTLPTIASQVFDAAVTPNAYLIKTVLNFNGTTNGIRVKSYTKLNTIDNIILNGATTSANGTIGLLIENNSKFFIGNYFGCSKFDKGLYAEESFISTYYTPISFTYCYSHGIHLKTCIFFLTTGLICSGNLGCGQLIQFSNGYNSSTIYANNIGTLYNYSFAQHNCSVAYNYRWGILVSGGKVDAQSSYNYNINTHTSTYPCNSFAVEMGGYINVKGSTGTGNGTSTNYQGGGYYTDVSGNTSIPTANQGTSFSTYV